MGETGQHRGGRLAALRRARGARCWPSCASPARPARPPAAALVGLAPAGRVRGLAGGLRSPGRPCRRSRATMPAHPLLRGGARDGALGARRRRPGRRGRGGRSRERRARGCDGDRAALRLDAGGLLRRGRLAFPVTYRNGAAAMFLVGSGRRSCWRRGARYPCAARRRAGGGAATLAGWLLTQSKGGGIALGLSAVACWRSRGTACAARADARSSACWSGSQFDRLTRPTRADGNSEARRGRRADAALADRGGRGRGLALRARRPPAATLGAVRAGSSTRAALVAVVVACIAVPVAFFAAVDHPVRLGRRRVARLQAASHETATSHFGSLGSNRYDFWRVALHEFATPPARRDRRPRVRTPRTSSSVAAARRRCGRTRSSSTP